MVLIAALELRGQRPVTPYNLEAWRQKLTTANLLSRFSKIIPGLAEGFVIKFPLITHTQSPPNNSSTITYAEDLNISICKEVTKGRYLGPYQSSPLSIIPKAGHPGKFRIIQNFSFFTNPSQEHPNCSVNHSISTADFPTTWGTFPVIYDLISQLPPGSEAATRDVAKAYRTIPLHPSQWPAGVVKVSDSEGYIDTNLAFGSTPAAGVYGHLSDACCEILRFHGFGPVDKWVDDHIFFWIQTEYLESYNRSRVSWHHDTQMHITNPSQSGGRMWFQGRCRSNSASDEFSENCIHPLISHAKHDPNWSKHDALFTYSLHNIDLISDHLGIPWEPPKDQPFSSTTIYIGFEWNLATCTVSLSTPKTTKYLQAIADWHSHNHHVLQEVKSLYGKLLHTCTVIVRGRAYLTGLERMINLCTPKPFTPHRPVAGISEDLLWWSQILSSNCASRPILEPPTYVNISAYSDASSSGIGITIGTRWRAWCLHPQWKSLKGKHDISWAEAVAFELLIHTVATIKFPHTAFILFGDNIGIIEGWRNNRHRNPPTNDVFKRIHSFIESLPRRFDICTKYVPSEDNPTDGPSRGILGDPSQLLPDIPIPATIRDLLAVAS